jgi:RNA polymerase sigma-70 factor (ECF subfamily)
VRDAMTTLSPAHRQVLELVYDEDLKLAQIAERLDVPLGTVKTRAHHALRALRAVLEERGWDG